MKVLIVGKGGREHALAWKISQSELRPEIHVAPGHAGKLRLARNVKIGDDDIGGLYNYVRDEKIDLTIIGPELPISMGLADILEANRYPVFAPSFRAARLETSKIFAKNFMVRHDIPTADFRAFQRVYVAEEYIASTPERPLVVKASGLAGGKGVLLPNTRSQASYAVGLLMETDAFGNHDEIVIEERLEGKEMSFFTITDGANVHHLGFAQDYKRRDNGDTGPNTGGMGSICHPHRFGFQSSGPYFKQAAMIAESTIEGMAREGFPYRGVLYTGFMAVGADLHVLEYNCRFGDPETQAMMPLFEDDILPMLYSVAKGTLREPVSMVDRVSVCVTMADSGYPGSSKDQGDIITGIDTPVHDTVVFHAGTDFNGASTLVNGGRVISVVGTGRHVTEAQDNAYHKVGKITWGYGPRYRTDIGEGR